jgi:hypothetical protein
MKSILLVGLLAISTNVFAQESIPVGTILPVKLETSLSNKSAPGQLIKARVMQDVPIENGSMIHAGAKVTGHVVTVAPNGAGRGSEISLTFDQLLISDYTVPIKTNLRALASTMEVDDAGLPDTGPDRGTPYTAYTTTQVGGDEVVYRGGGHVMNTSEEVVGEPVPPDGVLARVLPNPKEGCRGQMTENELPQALWIFSSDACGVYGYPHLRIISSGSSDPLGQIVLAADESKLNVRGGSAMLLRIIAADQVGLRAPKRS